MREFNRDTADALATARRLVADSERVVVLTGAGISTPSGIPDFRGPDGVWTRNPEAERLATIGIYMNDRAVRERAWVARRENPVWTARPNVAHMALVTLERSGRLDTLVTQNIDGLHLDAGHDPGRVVEVHGTIRDAVCTACDWSAPIGEVFVRIDAGDADPPCPSCEGILKTATVYFGEALDPDRLDRALVAAASADVLVTIGTTLSVGPINSMVPVAVHAGVPVVIVNGEPTDMDALATVIVAGDVVDVVPALLR